MRKIVQRGIVWSPAELFYARTVNKKKGRKPRILSKTSLEQKRICPFHRHFFILSVNIIAPWSPVLNAAFICGSGPTLCRSCCLSGSVLLFWFCWPTCPPNGWPAGLWNKQTVIAHRSPSTSSAPYFWCPFFWQWSAPGLVPARLRRGLSVCFSTSGLAVSLFPLS